jgi:CubicO group peptidase (beta-lactamase class C family)
MKDRKLRILFTPGEHFLYSGEGHRYLQFVIEHLGGRDLDALAGERMFRPLGMAHTSYAWREQHAANCAIDREAIEKVLGPDILKAQNCAGSLLTTAADYGRFLSAMLAGRGFPHALRDEMRRPQTAIVSPSLFGRAVPATPVVEGGPDRFWCLGWGGFRSRDGAVRFHVGYDPPEFENYAVLYLGKRLGLVVLTGGGRGPRSAVPAIVEAVLGPDDTPFPWAGYE